LDLSHTTERKRDKRRTPTKFGRARPRIRVGALDSPFFIEIAKGGGNRQKKVRLIA